MHWPKVHDGANLEDKIVGSETDLTHVTSVLSLYFIGSSSPSIPMPDSFSYAAVPSIGCARFVTIINRLAISDLMWCIGSTSIGGRTL